ncbi:phosphatase PAP2 family protein [Streptomyces sp. NBC_01304]|uniref:phosphatase PAP2 family protein n=1 Tax=Streptomyces sp. NBC_01304 TaxID=2903818 RepID=UPI002E0E9494|nr:phosphatase PAP2 family protein [Streptomyces sp. NBC_01304]
MPRTLLSPPESPSTAPGDPQPAVPRGSLMLALAVGALLVPLLLGLVIRGDVRRPPFQGLDDTWLRWMGGPHDGVPQALASGLNWFGGPNGALVTLGLLVLLLVLRRWRAALFLLVTVLATQVAVQGLKHLVDRPRPAHPLVQVDHGSFPSGHAATMAMTVVVLIALFGPAAGASRRWWWGVGLVLTLGMMWSRTWLQAHWLSDTVVGALTGGGVACLVWWVGLRLGGAPRSGQARLR